MNCSKNIIRVGAGLTATLIAAYWALPEFRTAIVGLAPFAVALVCPLSMLLMMTMMTKKQEQKQEKALVPMPVQNEPANPWEIISRSRMGVAIAVRKNGRSQSDITTELQMKTKVLAALIGLALLAGCADDSSPEKVASGPVASESAFYGTDITGIDYQTGFQLTDHHGKPRTMADFQGKVTLVFFGFANCPDVCPTTLARMSGAVNQLGFDGEKVQGLFITLDPRRDTPEVLEEYVSRFHPSFLGLRGDEQSLERLTKNYHVHMKSHAKMDEHGEHVEENYMVEHSGAVFVLDQAGMLRLIFVGVDWTSDQMARDLKRLIKAQ